MPDPDRVQRDKATILSIIKYLMFAMIAVAIVYFGSQLIVILLPFIIGFILARVANSLARSWKNISYRIMNRRHGQSQGKQYPRGLSRSKSEKRIAVTFFIFEVVAFFALIIGILFATYNQLQLLVNYLPELIANSDIVTRFNDFIMNISAQLGLIIKADLMASISEQLELIRQSMIAAAPGIAAGILNAMAAFLGYLPLLLFIIIVIIMSGYYFVVDGKKFYLFVRRNILSKNFRENSFHLVESLSNTLFRVIGGYSFLIIVTFVECLVGLLIINMPYAVILALICAIVDYLPFLGIGFALLPIAAYLFIVGNVWGGIGALILMAATIVVRRIIEPPVVGRTLNLHPMATIVAMIIGLGLYGLAGIFIGPIFFVIGKELMQLYGFDKKLRKSVGEILDKVSS